METHAGEQSCRAHVHTHTCTRAQDGLEATQAIRRHEQDVSPTDPITPLVCLPAFAFRHSMLVLQMSFQRVPICCTSASSSDQVRHPRKR
jgi:hypothetical protein